MDCRSIRPAPQAVHVTMHDLLLFDLDGTLTDPIEGIGRSINFALASSGYEERALTELGRFIGPPLDRTFAELVGTEDEAEIAALVASYRDRYGDVGFSENVVYPGVREALTHLTEHGARMGVCTSKRQDFAERILHLFELRDHFEFVSGGDVGIAKWQQIEALLADGVVSRDSVMIGDRSVDITAAHRNGLAAAGVLWGYGPRPELESESPRYLFAVPDELTMLARLKADPTTA